MLPASVTPEDRAAVEMAGAFLQEQGARRVWLFGSLAKGRKPGVHSAFDFAVEALPPERYLGSLGWLLQKVPRPVDLAAGSGGRGS
jgi:predicted nucleotidyltransferase